MVAVQLLKEIKPGKAFSKKYKFEQKQWDTQNV